MKKINLILIVFIFILTFLCGCQNSSENQEEFISKLEAVSIAKAAATKAYEKENGALIPPKGSTSDGVCFTSIQDYDDNYTFRGLILVDVEDGMLSSGEIQIEVLISKSSGKVISTELG